jgi:hypothetical protein
MKLTNKSFSELSLFSLISFVCLSFWFCAGILFVIFKVYNPFEIQNRMMNKLNYSTFAQMNSARLVSVINILSDLLKSNRTVVPMIELESSLQILIQTIYEKVRRALFSFEFTYLSVNGRVQIKWLISQNSESSKSVKLKVSNFSKSLFIKSE